MVLINILLVEIYCQFIKKIDVVSKMIEIYSIVLKLLVKFYLIFYKYLKKKIKYILSNETLSKKEV